MGVCVVCRIPQQNGGMLLLVPSFTVGLDDECWEFEGQVHYHSNSKCDLAGNLVK